MPRTAETNKAIERGLALGSKGLKTRITNHTRDRDSIAAQGRKEGRKDSGVRSLGAQGLDSHRTEPSTG